MSEKEKLKFLLSEKPRQAYLERFLRELPEDEEELNNLKRKKREISSNDFDEKVYKLTKKIERKKEAIKIIQSFATGFMPAPFIDASQEEIFKYLIALEKIWLLGQDEENYTEHFIFLNWKIIICRDDNDGLADNIELPMKSKEEAEKFLQNLKDTNQWEFLPKFIISKTHEFRSYWDYFCSIGVCQDDKNKFGKDEFLFSIFLNGEEMFIEEEKVPKRYGMRDVYHFK